MLATWLFKQDLGVPVESVIKVRVTQPTENDQAEERFPVSNTAFVNYSLRRNEAGDNFATVDANIETNKQQGLILTDNAQKSSPTTLQCGSVSIEKILKRLFVEAI